MSDSLLDPAKREFLRFAYAVRRIYGPLSPFNRAAERRCAQQLAGVRHLCLFIGHDRSGHSLIGHLLNQHPNAAIAHEYNLLEQIQTHGASRLHQLLIVMLELARHTQNKDLVATGYRYRKLNVEPSGDGQIHVLGDKKAMRTTDMLAGKGVRILKTLARADKSLKFIFIARNPYDVITSTLIRHVFRESMMFEYNLTIDECAEKIVGDARCKRELSRRLPLFIEEHFQRARAIQTLLDDRSWSLMTTRLVEFTEKPAEELSKILNFLDLEAPPDYLDEATKQVRPSPPSRNLIRGLWTDKLIARIADGIQNHDFLRDYSFESP